MRQIESGGYQVTGGGESIGDGQDGPLRVTARNIESGQRHTCTGKPKSLPMPPAVHTRGIAGEAEALGQLAEMVGIWRSSAGTLAEVRVQA